ncbi:hypothetical protein D3C71_2180680 [compost metagenome]
MPVGIIINILPVVEVILGKLVGIRGIFDKGVAIVTGDCNHLHLRIKFGISLCSGKRSNTLLQGHP